MSDTRCHWPLSNQTGKIEDGGVPLWFVDLRLSSEKADRLWAILSEDERKRAARFLATKDQDRFVVSRGLLRTLLGGYLSCTPQAIRFQYNYSGKPFLADDLNTDNLQFNLSHSEDVLLLGITQGHRIGVDVERLDSGADCLPLAKNFFAAAEYEALTTLHLSEQNAAWFRSWTVKEAYLKAVGVGLRQPLDSVEVSVTEMPARLLRIAGDASEAARWQTQTVTPCAGFVGALVVESSVSLDIQYKCWQW